MPNIVNITLTNTFEEWRVKDNEIGAAIGDLSKLNLGAEPGDETVILALNALRIDANNNANWIGTIGTLYGGNTDLTTGVNTNRADITTIAAVANIDISSGSLTNYDGAGTCSDTTYTSKATCETALETWTVAVDQNNDPVIGIIDILSYDYYRLNTHDTEIGTTSSLYNYATYPSLVTSANNLNSRLSDIETDVGDWSTYTDIANDATIVAAMNSIKVIHDDIGGNFVNVSGDTMSGKLVANGGIGATTSLTLGVGTGTAITVNNQQRLGIGVAPHSSYKMDVNGTINATALKVSGSTLTEVVQDIVGGMVTGNTESGIGVVYQDGDGILDFNVADPTITLTGDVTGSATMTNLGDISISTSVGNDSHTHAWGNITGRPSTFTPTTENVQDIVGAMVANPNLEDGIGVTYNDTTGKLDFNVADPTITLTGAIEGTATMTNLGSVTISTSMTSTISALKLDVYNVSGAKVF